MSVEQGRRKRCLGLIGAQRLLGEGLWVILSHMDDLELVGPWDLNPTALEQIERVKPDIVLIAGPDLGCEMAHELTARILEGYPDLPVIQVGLIDTVVRVFTAKTLPARSTDLIQAIRMAPLTGQTPDEGQPKGKST